jgi:tetratricopeptide (TPR) repeat protein
MGIIGLVSYLLLLFQSIRISVKAFFTASIERDQRFFFLAIIASLLGYVIFGIADFDDTTILFYLFLIFALLKSNYNLCFPSKPALTGTRAGLYQKAALLFLTCFIFFSFYIDYRSINDIRADGYYLKGRNLFSAGEFNESVKALNTAVIINYSCAEYKVTLANYVYSYCAGNSSMNPKTKSTLLKQAEEEMERAKENIKSELLYKSIISMIYLEEGNTEPGRKLIDEVFAADSLALSLRNNLARYYLAAGDYEKMFKELSVISKYDPLGIDLKKTYLIYYLKINDTSNALLYTEQILNIEPKNVLMQKLIYQLKNKEKPAR